MIQNSSMFSADEQDELVDSSKSLVVSKCYEDIKFVNKPMKPSGHEVEVIKDFHIEIKSNGESHIMDYNAGEVFDVVKLLFKKYIYLGTSPSGLNIVSEINPDYFKLL